MKTTVSLKKLCQSKVEAKSMNLTDDGALFIDFGKAVYGTVVFKTSVLNHYDTISVHFGEKLNEYGRIDRDPPGTIRHLFVEQKINHKENECRIHIPPDERNTGANAIKMPKDIGEVIPFRYLEVENFKLVDKSDLHQVFVHYPFNDNASHFECSDTTLNAVWAICKYTLKATTFCGVYVDGDRERIPYEGDAYINQLGHYCVDAEYDFARYSHEYMISNPTWCTEWHLHSVLMAWADYLYSGQTTSLESFYEELKVKTLSDFSREDGLISTDEEWKKSIENKIKPHFESGLIVDRIRDVVDWPPGSFTDGGTGERDNHEMLPINTVVNAFHCHSLSIMAKIAATLRKEDDKQRFTQRAEHCLKSIQTKLFDKQTGLYLDGEGSTHSSIHSNFFMLAFNLVPKKQINKISDFLISKGMAGSVYAAQHLLDALYMNHQEQPALELMRARHDRSWWNMIQAGSTMTLEAWDIKYKKNLDWNHAWGAAPANIIPRYLLGVRPIEPGFSKVLIEPQIGDLKYAKGLVPTPKGAIQIEIHNQSKGGYVLKVNIPVGINADISIPFKNTSNHKYLINDEEYNLKINDKRLIKKDLSSGDYYFKPKLD